MDVGLFHALAGTPAAERFPNWKDLAPDVRAKLTDQLAGQALRLSCRVMATPNRPDPFILGNRKLNIECSAHGAIGNPVTIFPDESITTRRNDVAGSFRIGDSQLGRSLVWPATGPRATSTTASRAEAGNDTFTT